VLLALAPPFQAQIDLKVYITTRPKIVRHGNDPVRLFDNAGAIPARLAACFSAAGIG